MPLFPIRLCDVDELFLVVPAIGDLSRIVVSLLGKQHTVERDALRSIRMSPEYFYASSQPSPFSSIVDHVSRAGVRRISHVLCYDASVVIYV